MSDKPPRAHQDFVERFPRLDEAWSAIQAGEAEGPWDERTLRLVKLAVAVGAKQKGAVSSSVRKGLKAGLEPRELEHVAACAASTLGLPAAVMTYGWIRDAVAKSKAS